MSTNVFGNPVTNTTVRLIYPSLGENQITARHRAEVAIEYMNAGGRAHAVSEFVHNLRRDVRPDTATLCMLYNATGNNLTLFQKHSWTGEVAGQFYPYLIQNGQWIGFLHVMRFGQISMIPGSCEAVVYRGLDNTGQPRYWILSWRTPFRSSPNRVYTEIHSGGSMGRVDWNNIFNMMGRQTNHHSATALGCSSNVTIGAGATPEFVGTMTLIGLTARFMDMASDVSTIFPSLDSKHDDEDDDGAEDDPTTTAE